MKKRISIMAIAMILVLAIAGFSYAAWRQDASNANNTVTIGDAVTISLDKTDGTKYFTATGLYDGGVTAHSAITVTAGATFVLKVSAFEIGGESAPTEYTVDNGLYLEIDDAEDFVGSTKVVFKNGAEITSGSSNKTVYVRIGLGASADVAWAGRTVTFAIATSAT